jgi:hypothetical protein
MDSVRNEAFGKIAETLIKDSNVYAAEWRKKIGALFDKAQISENASNNQTLILNPMNIRNLALEDFSSATTEYLVFVILSKDPRKFYERLEGLYAESKIIGMGRVKLHNSPAVAITYMNEHIGHLFPLFNEVIETSEKAVSCKYYLPTIYRYLEEIDSPPPFIFEAERQWISLINSDIPIGRFTFQEQSEKARQMHRVLMEFGNAVGSTTNGSNASNANNAIKVYRTGLSAALPDLGVKPEMVPFPIELTTEDLEATSYSIRGKLAPFGKVEMRQFGINHPSGNWYLTVMQFIVEERLVLMLYDTIRYMVYGATRESNELSPLAVMAQLCYSAWLLERRGIDRSKWVYSVLQRYREKLCTTGDKEKYEVHGSAIEWAVHYLRRSKQLAV